MLLLYFDNTIIEFHTFVSVGVPLDGVFIVEVKTRMCPRAGTVWLLPMAVTVVQSFGHV